MTLLCARDCLVLEQGQEGQTRTVVPFLMTQPRSENSAWFCGGENRFLSLPLEVIAIDGSINPLVEVLDLAAAPHKNYNGVYCPMRTASPRNNKIVVTGAGATALQEPRYFGGTASNTVNGKGTTSSTRTKTKRDGRTSNRPLCAREGDFAGNKGE